MIKLLDLIEAKQVGTLYHFTTIEGILEILKSNKLVSSGGSISFTRNKNYLNEPGSYGKKLNLVRISINGDKLSNSYKINPFHNSNKFEKDADEFEERIFTKGLKRKSIENIKDYITEITIDRENIKKFTMFNYAVELLQGGSEGEDVKKEAEKMAESELKNFYSSLQKFKVPVRDEKLNNKL
jgi:hypothetical protein